MSLEPEALKQRADQVLDAMPEDGRPLVERVSLAVERARRQLSDERELQALRWSDVDLAAGVIRVERGWDVREGVIELKSNAARRRVPIVAALRDRLAEHRILTGRSEGVRVRLDRRAAGRCGRPEQAGRRSMKGHLLDRITLHECRHTFASLMIAAGVNAKALSTFMGHAGISITLDRYGHLMPGSETEAASLLDAYLSAERKRAEEQARAAVA